MKNIFVTALLLATLVILPGAGCSVSTAALSDAKMCTAINTDYNCTSDMSEFKTDTPEIFSSVTLKNAPDKTKVTFSWRYLSAEQPVDIDSVVLESKEGTTNLYSSMPIPPKGAWPTGKYEVVIKLDSDNGTPVTKSFEVK